MLAVIDVIVVVGGGGGEVVVVVVAGGVVVVTVVVVVVASCCHADSSISLLICLSTSHAVFVALFFGCVVLNLLFYAHE